MRIDKNTTIRLGNRNIVKVKLGDVVIWQESTEPEPVGPDYFYIENTYAGTNTISLKDNETIMLSRDLQYSKDKDNWTTFTPSTTALDISLNQGEKLYIRGDANRGGVRLKISGSQAHIVGGNINTLIKYDDPNNVTLFQYGFSNLFNGDKNLTSASNLTLPATTLKMYCYNSMFRGCTSLTTAPELPALELAPNCYQSMFSSCSSLTTAPKLPATTLASGCYRYMFNYCHSLTTAPELPATNLAPKCYEGMFDGCDSLTTAPELPALELADSCYQSMFHYCHSLTTAPALPATTLAPYCYNSMFDGCDSLTTAPELPALALADSCYQSMFSNCHFLNNITVYAHDISALDCTTDWLSGVAPTGTFRNLGFATYPTDSTSGIPSGWTLVTT